MEEVLIYCAQYINITWINPTDKLFAICEGVLQECEHWESNTYAETAYL